MRVGLSLVPVRPDQMVDVAARAEELGYESLFLPDHVAFPTEVASRYPYEDDGVFKWPTATPLYDPLVTLGRISAVTEQIRLGTAIYVLPLRHPLTVAREVLTLDVLSGGRVLLGVGIGWLEEEFRLLGLDFSTRASRTEEAVQVMRALWTEEEPSFHGRHFSVEGLRFEPKPASQPHPPVLMGGEADGALARAARVGDGWISGDLAITPAALRDKVDRMAAVRDEAGRAGPFEVTVLVGQRREPEDLLALAHAGADRVVVTPWTRARDAVAGMEGFAAEVLPELGD